MKQPEVAYTQHVMRFPFAYVIFGKTFEMPCEAIFEFAENDDEDFRIKVSAIAGWTDDGTEYDLTFLTEDEDSMYATFIIACIVENQTYWDYKSEVKEWWQADP